MSLNQIKTICETSKALLPHKHLSPSCHLTDIHWSAYIRVNDLKSSKTDQIGCAGSSILEQLIESLIQRRKIHLHWKSSRRNTISLHELQLYTNYTIEAYLP